MTSKSSDASKSFTNESLGPPGVRGELHVLPIMVNEQRKDVDRLRDKSIRPFKVVGRLAKSNSTSEELKIGFVEQDGSTYILMPKDAVAAVVQCAGGTFEVKKNSAGEMALVEFRCETTSVSEARKQFTSFVLPYLDHLSYLANCPIVLETTRVEDEKNQRTTVGYIAPYRKVIIGSHARELFIEMAPVYAMYREAKNSFSDFYKFLCFYKILEGLLGKMRAQVFARAREVGIVLDRPKETIPALTEIPEKYKKYIGKSVKTLFDEVLTPQFRNAVAHFVTDDGAVLNMSSANHIDEYANILFLTESSVRIAIESHEILLSQRQAKT